MRTKESKSPLPKRSILDSGSAIDVNETSAVNSIDTKGTIILGKFISTESFTMWEDQQLQVVYRPLLNDVLPEKYAESLVWTWESDDPGIVDVDETGTITALEEGSTIVRVICTDEQLSASVTVHVVSSKNKNMLTLPSMLTTVESEAFAGLGIVSCIELGDLVSQIDSRAFADNNQLWQIIVSNWDATFAQDALENTPAILVLEHEPTESNFAFPYALNQ